MSITSKLQPSSATRGMIPVLLAVAGLALSAAPVQSGNVLPPQSNPYGQTYAQWSAAWWQWALSRPVTGHPFIDDPAFDVRAGQSGNVWFLAGAFGTLERSVTIPKGTALFIGMLNIEASTLEAPPFFGATEAEQRAIASTFADLIVNVSCSIDGVPVSNIDQYRVQSPQYTFTAPTPWIFGETGGTGTSVADGYYVMVPPLSKGQHKIQFSGAFRFSDEPGDEAPMDVTLLVTVVK